jgi:hypothetical protein
MAPTNVAQLAAKLYELLEPLSAEDRTRVVQATLILFGDEQPAPPSRQSGSSVDSVGNVDAGDAQTYFNEKAPQTKGEALAVAARYREISEREETHSKADLKKVITEARRNFDDHNFTRDIDNAKRQAGFFNVGTGRDANKLSYYGQQFVDALPDRERAANLSRPRVGGNRKRTTRKATRKPKRASG